MATLGLDILQPLMDPEKIGLKMNPNNNFRRQHSVTSGSGTVSPSSSTDDFSGSAHLNRLPNMEPSSGAESRRITSMCASRHPRSNRGLSERDSNANALAGVAAPLLQKAQSCLSRGEEQKSGKSQSVLRTSKSYEDIGVSDSETVILEEKRRKLHGDGFTVHRYKRGRLLGKGGFAKVYFCTALDSNKAYAVKIVPKANLVKARARQKLQAEIKIHRTLKHRHVCEYKHFFEDKSNCYILLELCHNQSLNEMIKRRKRLTEQEAAYFMRQLLEAVQYMHANSVIHRDLKLGNLFLDKNLIIKVGDLGLATRLENKDEKRKTICGTPNYIAPEVIQGDKTTRGHSFEVDIWSMGVILYTILFGKPPYEAKDVKATYQRILSNEYVFPRRIEASDDAKDLIAWMLQSKPSDRPSLDSISAHPFLSKKSTPESLPTSALHVAPSWRLGEQGWVIKGDEMTTEKPRKPALPRLGPSRQPFASRDNVAKPTADPLRSKKELNGRDIVESQLITKGAHASTKAKASNAQAGFKIYDETGPVEKSKKDCQKRMERGTDAGIDAEGALVSRTRSLSVASPQPQRADPTPDSQSSTSSTGSQIEADPEVQRRMIEKLDAVLDITEFRRGTYTSVIPQPTVGKPEPAKWVSRYVDYTSKYGLGFLMNNGSSGVYFNDSTKAVLAAEGESFQYVERKKMEGRIGSDRTAVRRTDVVEDYSLSSHPAALKKKVTLLKHFRNYLIDQRNGDEDFAEKPSPGDVSSTKFVYVKKWIRTKHAILFRLSNQTVQVVFHDQTEVLLTPDCRYISYVDKNRRRLTYLFTDELVGSSPDVENRLKYVKGILCQMAAGQRR